MTPKWLETARKYEGIHEVDGSASDPTIMSWFKSSGGDWVKDDSTTPWCGAFVGGVATECGLPLAKEPLRARSWAEWGDMLDEPREGCIVVFPRGGDPSSGHVGIVDHFDGDFLWVLGGNQNDSVSVARFKRASAIAYRWPSGEPQEPAKDVPKVVEIQAKPLQKSGTVWATVMGVLAAVGQYFEKTMQTGLDVVAQVTAWEPLKAMLLQAGGNSKALALGFGVAAGVAVVGRRAQSQQAAKEVTS